MALPESVSVGKAGDEADASAKWVNGHPDDGVLHAGLDNQLSAAESALVADHVSRCASCRGRAAEAHGAIAGARRIVKRVKEADQAAGIDSNNFEFASVSTHARGSTVSVGEKIAATTGTEGAAEKPPSTVPAKAVTVSGTDNSKLVAPSQVRVTGSQPVQPWSSKSWNIPWARIGMGAAFFCVIASGVIVWRAVGTDFGQNGEVAAASAPPRQSAISDSAHPKMYAVASELSPSVVAASDSANVPAVVANEGPTAATPPTPPTGAAFDSLVVTRRACASQCNEFTLFVNSVGAVHYVVHVPGGKDQSLDATVDDAPLKKLSAMISRVLFETSAVPVSGRSVCTVIDASHVQVLRLMVAHGTSRVLHANSCSASSKVLLDLSAHIDSLAGADGLQQSLMHPAK